MTTVWIHGITGRMGQALKHEIEASSLFQLKGGSALDYCCHFENNQLRESKDFSSLESAKLLIDFSSKKGNEDIFKILKNRDSIPSAVLIATTALTKTAIKDWENLAKNSAIRLLIAPNTSLGILIQMQVSKQIARILKPHDFDIEIVESHHRHKIDSPSGTANFLAENLAEQEQLDICTNRLDRRKENEIGVTAVRGGNVFGEHTVRFMGLSEELEVSHRALSRELFAKGALVLSQWLMKQKPNTYKLEDIDLSNIGY